MQNWEYKKLGDICRVINGRAYSDEEFLDKGKYRVLRVGNFFTNNNWYYSDLELDEDKYCEEGDLLYAWSASFGPKIWRGEKVIYHYHIWKLEPSLDVDKFYLFWWLQSDNMINQFSSDLHGATMHHITKGLMESLNVPLPPLEEQKRIVKILDEKFAMLETVKANAKINLQNAKDLFQSQLSKAFSNTTWEKKRLGKCGSFKNGMNFASTDTGYTIRSLGVGDFKNLYQIDDTEQLSEISLKAAPSEDYLLKDGDIVFVRSNGNKELVGRCLLVYPKNIPTTYSGFCIRFRKDYDELDADFLLHYMKAESSRKILNGKEGANISNLNQKILGDFEVPVPPLPEQKRIVEQLDSLSEKVRSLEEIYTKQLANCDELKQAFLAKSFNGEL